MWSLFLWDLWGVLWPQSFALSWQVSNIFFFWQMCPVCIACQTGAHILVTGSVSVKPTWYCVAFPINNVIYHTILVFFVLPLPLTPELHQHCHHLQKPFSETSHGCQGFFSPHYNPLYQMTPWITQAYISFQALVWIQHIFSNKPFKLSINFASTLPKPS